ncbi:MAG TPA: LpqB family beta-propeller domain-containing protein [Dehalococcoidia bacterium]|nr:LpqB family beta-propeller domain-containing protein [Dehalococcoidia bacterium]
MTPKRPALALIAVLALIAMGCSDDGREGSTPTATPPGAAETPQPEACSGTLVVNSNSNTGEARLLTFRDGRASLSEPIGTGMIHPVVSPEGRRVAYYDIRPSPALWVADSDGRNARRLADILQLHDHNPPVWSPRGDRIAFESARSSSEGARSNVWVVNADGTGLANLTATMFSADTPTWSPDGSRIAFMGREIESTNVYVVNSDGSGLRRVTNYDQGSFAFSGSWSPDGSLIAYLSNTTGNVDIFTVRPDGTGVTNLTRSPTPEFVAPVGHLPIEFSPDGKRLAFLSEATGSVELYTIATDGSGLRRVTDLAGSEFRQRWTRDGRCLTFYVSRPSPQGGIPVYVVREDGTGLIELTTLR